MCEGWSLEIWTAYVCQVIRRDDLVKGETKWEATINQKFYGAHPSRQAAMAWVEQNLERDMSMVLDVWQEYQTEKAKR
jgi:hypothetical protein